MIRAKNRFEEGLQRIRNLDALYSHLKNNVRIPENEISHILRSEIMYSVSCFDKLIHDLVRQGMVETFLSRRASTNSYRNFTLSIDQVELISNSSSIPPPQTEFENIVSEKHKHLSFQDPSKVTEALSLIWSEPHKWNKIAQKISLNERDVRTELKNIIIRRNQIVHESDINLYTQDVEPILQLDAVNSVNFIEKIGNAIYDLVA